MLGDISVQTLSLRQQTDCVSNYTAILQFKFIKNVYLPVTRVAEVHAFVYIQCLLLLSINDRNAAIKSIVLHISLQNSKIYIIYKGFHCKLGHLSRINIHKF